MTWWLLTFKKQKSATLPMILKRQPWNYVMAHIWFLIGLELIVWWQTLANFRLCFSGQTLIIAKITSIIENKIAKSRSEIKLVGITIGDKLSFTTHIGNLCSTASNRLQDLARGYQSLRTVLWSGCFVAKLQTILLTKSINAACVLYNGRCKFRRFIN